MAKKNTGYLTEKDALTLIGDFLDAFEAKNSLEADEEAREEWDTRHDELVEILTGKSPQALKREETITRLQNLARQVAKGGVMSSPANFTDLRNAGIALNKL